MEGNPEDGGLKMVNVVHLQKAFYLQWVGKLAKSREEKWTHIPRWCFLNWETVWGCLTAIVALKMQRD